MSRLAKQPLHGGSPDALHGLSDGTSGKQLRSCFTVSAQIKAANNLGNGFIAEKRHADHHPNDHIPGKRRRLTVAWVERERQCCNHSTGRCSVKS